MNQEYEIIVFLAISISFLAPEFVLNKFYPKFDEKDFYNPSNATIYENMLLLFENNKTIDYISVIFDTQFF